MTRPSAKKLTAERARALLDYDPITGVFRWTGAGNYHQVAGKVAGCLDPTGYRRIRIDREFWQEHRLAVLWMTGSIPSGMIDHRNQRKGDNRWANIRSATVSQNAINHTSYRPTWNLPRGVRPCAKRFFAVINADGKRKRLGTFDTPEEAHAAYCKAAIKHHGEFACFDARPAAGALA